MTTVRSSGGVQGTAGEPKTDEKSSEPSPHQPPIRRRVFCFVVGGMDTEGYSGANESTNVPSFMAHLRRVDQPGDDWEVVPVAVPTHYPTFTTPVPQPEPPKTRWGRFWHAASTPFRWIGGGCVRAYRFAQNMCRYHRAHRLDDEYTRRTEQFVRQQLAAQSFNQDQDQVAFLAHSGGGIRSLATAARLKREGVRVDRVATAGSPMTANPLQAHPEVEIFSVASSHDSIHRLACWAPWIKPFPPQLDANDQVWMTHRRVDHYSYDDDPEVSRRLVRFAAGPAAGGGR